MDNITFNEKDKAGTTQSKFVHYKEIHGARHFPMINGPDDLTRTILSAVPD